MSPIESKVQLRGAGGVQRRIVGRFQRVSKLQPRHLPVPIKHALLGDPLLTYMDKMRFLVSPHYRRTIAAAAADVVVHYVEYVI